MEAEQLLHLVQHPGNIDPAALQALHKVVHQYPYFQIAYTLIAKGIYDRDPQQAQHAIQMAAVYASDRSHLKLLLEDKLGYRRSGEPNEGKGCADELSSADNLRNQFVEEFSPAEFINSYISTIHAKQVQEITKKKNLDQIKIIDNFIKQNVKIGVLTVNDISLEHLSKDLTQESADFPDHVLTESLARVMIKQGNLERAIHIYKRLQDRFPEKKAYFAALLEEITKDT